MQIQVTGFLKGWEDVLAMRGKTKQALAKYDDALKYGQRRQSHAAKWSRGAVKVHRGAQ
jgi:hypothetical protein